MQKHTISRRYITMKLNTALYVVAAIATLSLSSQAFAKGGGMGGSMSHGSTGGTPQMASTSISGGGSGMQQGTMQGNVTHQGPVVGSGSQNMTQGGSGNSIGHQHNQVHVNGTGKTTQQPPATTTN